jgi:hypothetical protein
MLMRRVRSQVTGSGQHNRPAAQSQWFATVQSGSTTLSRQRGQAVSYGVTAADASVVGHAVPLTECRVVGNKTKHVKAVDDTICYS